MPEDRSSCNWSAKKLNAVASEIIPVAAVIKKTNAHHNQESAFFEKYNSNFNL